jgi:hypothetical protein
MATKTENKHTQQEWSMSAQIDAAQKRISEWPAWMREAAYFSAALVSPPKNELDKTTAARRAKGHSSS